MTAGFDGEALSLSWPEDGLAWVTLTRPAAMNTITFGWIAELGRAVDAAEAGAARALVITGEGRAFCGGAELSYFTAPDTLLHDADAIRNTYVAPIAHLFSRIEALPFPAVAAINGYAFGGGCELALACDLRIMAASAQIGVTEVHVGAIPGAGGVFRLGRLLGRARAAELLLLGRRLTAAEAHRVGLVTEVVPDSGLADAARELVARLRGASPLALAEAKACLTACEAADVPSADAICLDAVARLAAGPEWREGMTAFVEKRRPRF